MPEVKTDAVAKQDKKQGNGKEATTVKKKCTLPEWARVEFRKLANSLNDPGDNWELLILLDALKNAVSANKGSLKRAFKISDAANSIRNIVASKGVTHESIGVSEEMFREYTRRKAAEWATDIKGVRPIGSMMGKPHSKQAVKEEGAADAENGDVALAVQGMLQLPDDGNQDEGQPEELHCQSTTDPIAEAARLLDKLSQDDLKIVIRLVSGFIATTTTTTTSNN